MDKKEFTKVTAEVFQAHGFIKIGNQFFLNLPRVVVRVYRKGARFEEGAYSFQYTVCFKDIHEEYEFADKDSYKNMPEDFWALRYLKSSEIVKDGRFKFQKRAFYPEEYTAERWREVLSEILIQEFTPYRNDFENFVREDLGPEPGKIGMGIAEKEAFMERGLIFKK